MMLGSMRTVSRGSAARSGLLALSMLATVGAMAKGDSDRVAGFQLYPGSSSSNVDGPEKILKDTGYKTAVCRQTPDSLAKVVAFYRNDKQLEVLGDPSKDDSITIISKTSASVVVNSPWMDFNTLKMNNTTMICIADRSAK